MRFCIRVVLIFVAALTPAFADDGELLSKQVVALDSTTLLEGAGPQSRQRLQSSLEKLASSIELVRIVYESDGLRVHGYMASPSGITGDDKLPCVIFNRGGNREFGALSDLRAATILGKLAQRGYIAVASQYRGNGGGEGREEFGGAEINDILNLIPLLEKTPRADATRIGMFGWSRGGMMTYLALAQTDRILGAVVGAGVSDSIDMVKRRPEMEEHVLAELVPDWAEKREEALAARSALLWPEHLHAKTPILILHGTADWRVHPSQALRMAEALQEAGRPYRLIMYEGGDHGLSEFRPEVDEAVGSWLDRYVRDRASLPNLEPHGR